MPLYHFSEEPNITRFVPRPPLAHPEQEPLVWAMDSARAALYYFPRDCPRICFWPLPTTTVADRERFWQSAAGCIVIAIEWDWYARLCATALYRYALPDATFVPEPGTDYGAYVSHETVTPLAVEAMEFLPDRLREADVELRLCPTLWPLHDAIIESSLHYSIIRWRNAQPRPLPGSDSALPR